MKIKNRFAFMFFFLNTFSNQKEYLLNEITEYSVLNNEIISLVQCEYLCVIENKKKKKKKKKPPMFTVQTLTRVEKHIEQKETL
jgi:hypothetical protein